jgi:hypothetical protein
VGAVAAEEGAVVVVAQEPRVVGAVMAGELLRGTAMGLRSATVVGQRSLRLVANIGPAPQPGASPPRGQEAVIRAVE